MKTRVCAVLVLLATVAPTAALRTNPLSKVIELLSSLEAKIIKEGEAEQKAYEEYVEWCDDASKNKGFEIKTLTAQKEELVATIAKCTSDGEEASVKIDELAKSIATSEAELKDATTIRDKENADFVAAEAELVDSIDTLDRAIAILEREMAKNPALVQVDTSSAKKLVQSMGAIIDAAGFSGTDQKKLVALVQSRQQDKDGDEDKAEADEALLGAPAADAYKSHSASIVDVLEDLKEKAEGELSDLRKAETNTQHNYDMLKQSLTDQAAADGKDMADEKSAKAEAAECVATSEGDLATTTKDLADAEETLATAQSTCMTVAGDHEATVKSRGEELEALATAKKILKESTAGAVEESYSFLQFQGSSQLKTRTDLANAEVVNIIKKLAREHHSAALAQLASKITAVLRFGAASGEDPFAKVKGLIQELIDRLMKEAAAEATEKEYCDSEMAKTEEKKTDLEADIAKLTAKIDKAAASSAELKADVKQLQAELADLAKTQAEMDSMRQEEHADFVDAKATLEQGLDGVRKALGVLREYYGAAFLQQQQPPLPEKHEKASGAGNSIIGILEVCESDFAKNLAERETSEADAEAQYQKITQENKVTKTLKDQDVKYKTAEFKSLDKAISEMTSDKETSTTELDAVLEYYSKLKDRCIAKPETYEERKRRREAEIAGLKEALTILENETAFMQKGHKSFLGRNRT
jgi:chromosome segregation ATPase